MPTIWYARVEIKNRDNISCNKSGLIVTPSPVILPNVNAVVGAGETLLCVRKIQLMLEFEKESMDFLLNQMK